MFYIYTHTLKSLPVRREKRDEFVDQLRIDLAVGDQVLHQLLLELGLFGDLLLEHTYLRTL